jgi:hypothetical protein
MSIPLDLLATRLHLIAHIQKWTSNLNLILAIPNAKTALLLHRHVLDFGSGRHNWFKTALLVDGKLLSLFSLFVFGDEDYFWLRFILQKHGWRSPSRQEAYDGEGFPILGLPIELSMPMNVPLTGSDIMCEIQFYKAIREGHTDVVQFLVEVAGLPVPPGAIDAARMWGSYTKNIVEYLKS